MSYSEKHDMSRQANALSRLLNEYDKSEHRDFGAAANPGHRKKLDEDFERFGTIKAAGSTGNRYGKEKSVGEI